MEIFFNASCLSAVDDKLLMSLDDLHSGSHKDKHYNFSFMGAALRPELALIIAECHGEAGADWTITKDRILASNALQCRTLASTRRLERELRHRLQELSQVQLNLLATGNGDDRTAMAWLSVLKHSRFVYEFVIDVLREKLAAHDPVLRPSDYETFIEVKSISHPELVELSSTSKAKIRQILLLMLSEAGLVGAGPSGGSIKRPVLSPRVRHAISSDSPRWLAGFLVPDEEIGEL